MVVQNLGSISKQICERELTECANDYSNSQSDQEEDYPFNDQEPEHILRRDTHLNDCQMFKPKLIPMEIDAEDYEIDEANPQDAIKKKVEECKKKYAAKIAEAGMLEEITLQTKMN